jgi:sulfite exporter TauE/SafE
LLSAPHFAALRNRLIEQQPSFLQRATGVAYLERSMDQNPADRDSKLSDKNSPRDYVEIGAAFVILFGILFVVNQLDFLPQRFAVSDEMSYGLVFVIGVVASISTCIAVTGGLLVAVAAKYNEASGNLTSVQRLKPHIYFNVGRVMSYTLLGGAIGALGSALTLSPAINGMVTIAASAVMILLGLQMLKVFPSLTRFMPTMPKAFSHRIHDFAESDTKRSAFVLGAATFFLPCGFTQALQLYVLAKGSFATGALTMLAFSLGTLPALFSLSAVSSFATGAFQSRFLKLAGAAVIVLGILNIQYGLVLASGDMSSTSVAANEPVPQAAAQVGAKQIAVMRIVGYEYVPSRFTVRQGVPVEWRIDASEGAGCGRILIAPKLGVRRLLPSNSTTTITFLPQETGDFGFNCGMGMMTPGSKFTVIPQGRG